ncbi:hypothetical protein RSOLAG1IB_07985 [Rhizoctonia solani AG-1 IB]|uniref:Uncharacterized protein n=1 Tax=Thanatephorus cucumeris (strain AG1-IB / isolate 7/3/14) TaxID=1108050 RepID=A0A0B7FIA9_THACB|nr:hypothetical protein RSOLAG1IB_07985 [Rhizoctonia solani AG-1 IB]
MQEIRSGESTGVLYQKALQLNTTTRNTLRSRRFRQPQGNLLVFLFQIFKGASFRYGVLGQARRQRTRWTQEMRLAPW